MIEKSLVYIVEFSLNHLPAPQIGFMKLEFVKEQGSE